MNVLLIVAHGSHLDATSSLPARRHAATIRQHGTFDEVRLGFWKEEPSLGRSLDGCEATRVVVVPFFMADGYFTRTVVPRELAPAVARFDEDAVTITAPAGAGEQIPRLIDELASANGATSGDSLFVLGHGTSRSTTSGATAATHAASPFLQARYAEVAPIYLDQEPSLSSLSQHQPRGRAFVVPLFVANGWHLGTSVPRALVEGGVSGVTVTSAVGECAEMADVIEAAALAAMKAPA